MPGSAKGRIRKCVQNRRKLKRAEVLKILAAAMENAASEAGGTSTSVDGGNSDFFTTGRVGRRNAMPDILNSHATVSTADLPDQLSALTTSDTPKKPSGSGGSNNNGMDHQPTASTSQTPSTSNS